MLQKSLNAVILQLFTQLDGIENNTFKSLADQGEAGKLSIQPPQLRRQIHPLEYISPLPFQLAAQGGQSPEGYVSQLAENFVQLCAFPQKHCYLSIPSAMCPVLRGVKPTLSAGGHLGLQLDEFVLLHWLKLLNQPGAWPPSELAVLPVSNFEIKQRSISQALGLSPLALIQHVHARSNTLLQLVPSPADLGETTTANDAFATAPIAACTTSKDMNLEMHKVVWTLTHLIDGCYELTSQKGLGERGYALSEVVYLWLKGINLNSLRTAYPHVVLQAVRQSLKHLLENRLGCPAVESF